MKAIVGLVVVDEVLIVQHQQQNKNGLTHKTTRWLDLSFFRIGGRRDDCWRLLRCHCQITSVCLVALILLFFSSSSGRSVLKMRRGNGYEMKKKKSTRELLYLIIWLYFCCLFKHFFLSSFRNLLGVLVQPTWTVFIVQCCGKQLIFSLSFAIIEFPLSHVGHER